LTRLRDRLQSSLTDDLLSIYYVKQDGTVPLRFQYFCTTFISIEFCFVNIRAFLKSLRSKIGLNRNILFHASSYCLADNDPDILRLRHFGLMDAFRQVQ
jgi:hypothetical protein